MRTRRGAAAHQKRDTSVSGNHSGEEADLVGIPLGERPGHDGPMTSARGFFEKADGFPLQGLPKKGLDAAIQAIPLLLETPHRRE